MVTMENQNPSPAVNVYPGNNNGGFGDMFGGMGGGAIFFWLILFFFMMMFMGWGNNGYANGNGNGGVQYVPYPPYPPYGMNGCGGNGNAGTAAAEAVRQGFDQSAVIGGINGLNAVLQQGFNNAEISRCNAQANTMAVLQNQAMALQQSSCDNRAGIADLKYTIATEACSDRSAVKDALQEVTAQNNANMNAMATMFNNGIQSLKNDFFQYQMSCKDDRIADLQRQLTFSQTAGLVNSSRDAIIANNDLQTAALEQYLAPTARPAYVVQNPNCCNQNYNPCNCNVNRCCGQ